MYTCESIFAIFVNILPSALDPNDKIFAKVCLKSNSVGFNARITWPYNLRHSRRRVGFPTSRWFKPGMPYVLRHFEDFYMHLKSTVLYLTRVKLTQPRSLFNHSCIVGFTYALRNASIAN